MDKLKALLQSKKQEVSTAFGESKALKRSVLEEQRVKRLREEEEVERVEKVRSS